jgi:hypothetical protein
VPERRFPDPRSTEETDACFIVQDGAEIEMLASAPASSASA